MTLCSSILLSHSYHPSLNSSSLHYLHLCSTHLLLPPSLTFLLPSLLSSLPLTLPPSPPLGSHLPLDSPALEFTNSVTHVLGLDPTLTHEVTSLKRLLLAQVMTDRWAVRMISDTVMIIVAEMTIYFKEAFLFTFFFFNSNYLINSLSSKNYPTQLRVREFSPESEFRDPALTYILKDVICSFCTSCR